MTVETSLWRNNFKLKRTIFCLVPSSWLLYLRCFEILFFEEAPSLTLTTASVLLKFVFCAVLSAFSYFFLTLVFERKAKILTWVLNLKNIFPLYVGHKS